MSAAAGPWNCVTKEPHPPLANDEGWMKESDQVLIKYVGKNTQQVHVALGRYRVYNEEITESDPTWIMAGPDGYTINGVIIAWSEIKL